MGKGLVHCVGSTATLVFWETIWLLDLCAAVFLQALVLLHGSPTAPFCSHGVAQWNLLWAL